MSQYPCFYLYICIALIDLPPFILIVFFSAFRVIFRAYPLFSGACTVTLVLMINLTAGVSLHAFFCLFILITNKSVRLSVSIENRKSF